MSQNNQVLAQLAALGTPENLFVDFLNDPSRGIKLVNGMYALDASETNYAPADMFAAVQGICRMAESLLSHLVEKYGSHERIRNGANAEKLLSLLRSGPVNDRRSLNRLIGTFYQDWPYAAHWRRDLYRIPQGGLTITALVFGGLQKLRDMMDERNGLA